MELKFPLILDGATGTQLQARGFKGDMCSEKWVLEHPEAILDIQQKYLAAGSDIVYAPSFGANRVKLEENGLVGMVDEYNHRLVALSREAVGDKIMVGGDIAPTGMFLAPMGDASFEDIYNVYLEQVTALEDAGVDMYAIETTMTVPEARAAVLAIKSISKKPVFVTFTVDENGKTLTGTDITAALVIMQGLGVDAFGMNCSFGPDKMLEQIERMQEYATIPLIAKPNAGMPQIGPDGKAFYELDPAVFYEYAGKFAKAGVGVFGGCCGSTEAHIKALYEATRDLEMNLADGEEKRVLATEKELYDLDEDLGYENVLACDEDLEDEIFDNEDDILAIRIESEDELENFEAAQYAISTPLCILCEDEAILEQALRLYQGRALYEGGLPEEVKERLSKTYGMVY